MRKLLLVIPTLACALSAQHPATQGIDKKGAISRENVPKDLQHPERWRYIPEGKLIEGSIYDRLWNSVFVVPVFFREESLGSGFGINYTDFNFNNSRRRQLLNIGATYSTEGQQRLGIFWRRRPDHREVKGGGIVFEERSSQSLGGGFVKHPTRRFFGLGSQTAKTDQTSYTDERSFALLSLSRPFPNSGDDLVFDVGITADHRRLSRGRASDLPSTDVNFPTLFAEDADHDMLWLNGNVRYDVLDSPANPYRGWSVGGGARIAPLQTGEDVGAIFDLRTEWAQAVWSPWHKGGSPDEENPPTDTIAIGAVVQSTSGDIPFWALPSLGGLKTQRGYVADRFTDRAAWHATFEYRFWPIPRGISTGEGMRIERLGMALFYDVGTVAGRLGRLGSADIKHSYGVSFRLTLERTMLFRIDISRSEEGTLVGLAYGLPF